MNNSFESFELSTELIFQRFLMDKERRHDEEMVKAIDDVVAFLMYRQ